MMRSFGKLLASVESHKVVPGKVSQSRAGLGVKSANRRLHQHPDGPFEAIEWPLEAQTAKNVHDLSIEFAQVSFRGSNLSPLPNRAVRLLETIGRYDFTRLNTSLCVVGLTFLLVPVSQSQIVSAGLSVDTAVTNDLDGDRRSDIVVWRHTSGTWYSLLSTRRYDRRQGFARSWGDGATDVPLLGDLDGDGRSDLIVWRKTTGIWYALLSRNSYSRNASFTRRWGDGDTDIPLLGDLDGDGRDDIVIWRKTTGMWYVLFSRNGYSRSASFTRRWGQGSQDIPVLGDLDGDGRDDIIVWRTTTGYWYVLLSSNGYSRSASFTRRWGQGSQDIPLLGDLDGDGRDDIVIWRKATGYWYVLLSRNGYSRSASFTRRWGQGDTDIPVLNNLDGDRRADIAVWRTTTGEWYSLLSSQRYSRSKSFRRPWGKGHLDSVPGTASYTPSDESLVFATFYSTFDPSNVISNNEFNDYNALTREQVRDFINSRGGPLVNRQFGGQQAYQIIYNAARNRSLTPKLLLATLQKEQSLITQHATGWPLSERLRCAMGCNAKITSGGCIVVNPNIGDMRGFSNQMSCAANSFRNRYNEGAQRSMPTWVTAYDNSNDRILVQNAATYALYRYTPSVSDKRNLHRIWLNFFGSDSGGQAPAAPSNLRATAVDAAHIRLTWSDNSGNESGFRIYDGSVPVATVGAGTTSYTVTGLSPNSYHCYHIYAYNDYGNSPWTGWACATTPPLNCSAYRAEYYNNRTLSGAPAYVRCEEWPIRHDWGTGGPGNGVGNDNFSVRWTGRAHITTGRYDFIARTDDGIRVWIGNNLLINEWRDQSATVYRETWHINDGMYDIKVEYYEHSGDAVAEFRWDESTCSGEGIGLEQTVGGWLSNFIPSEDYCFEGSSGQWISLRMFEHNSSLDPYIKIYAPSGQLVAQNDDGSGINLNSFVTYQLSQSGTYRIEATRYGSSSGDYRLRLEGGREAAVGDIDRNCTVNARDVSILMSRWDTADPDADLDLSGNINSLDSTILESNIGHSCSSNTLLSPKSTKTIPKKQN